MKLKITVSIEDIKFNTNKKLITRLIISFFILSRYIKLDGHSHNSRVLTMLPCSSKIKGYKGVITYGQKRG